MRHAPLSTVRWLTLSLLVFIAALALGTPAGFARQDATPTPAAIQVDARARLQHGMLCVSVYADEDANGLRGESERVLSGAQIAVRGAAGEETRLFDGTTDPLCLELPPGTYDISVILPGSYTLTTSGALRVTLAGGRVVQVAFGGASGYTPDILIATPETPPDALTGDSAPVYAVRADDDGGDSLVDRLYAVSGVILLALAGVIAVVAVVALALFRRRG